MKGAVWIIGIVGVILVAGAYLIYSWPGIHSGTDRAAATALVEEFGKRLQLVSLLGEPQGVGEAMDTHYTPFVTSALLNEWKNNPTDAPGRLTSSPYPDRIEVESVDATGERIQVVRGNIVEVTSADQAGAGTPIRRPVTVTVELVGGEWKISSFQMGAYPDSS